MVLAVHIVWLSHKRGALSCSLRRVQLPTCNNLRKGSFVVKSQLVSNSKKKEKKAPTFSSSTPANTPPRPPPGRVGARDGTTNYGELLLTASRRMALQSEYQRPDASAVAAFKNALERRKIETSVRETRGLERPHGRCACTVRLLPGNAKRPSGSSLRMNTACVFIDNGSTIAVSL